jgi:anti-sigma factor RsiW
VTEEAEPTMESISRREFLRLGAGVATGVLAAGPLSQLVAQGALAAARHSASPFASGEAIALSTVWLGSGSARASRIRP